MRKILQITHDIFSQQHMTSEKPMTLREKHPLASLLIEEARTKKYPIEWLENLKRSMQFKDMNEDQLYEMLTIAAEGAIDTRTGTLEQHHFMIVSNLDMRQIFKPTFILKKEPPFRVHTSNNVGICGAAEGRFMESLGVHPIERYNAQHSARGIVLFCEGVPAVYMKLVGLKSCVSFESVADRRGNILLGRGMIYALPYQTADLLNHISIRKVAAGAWLGLDMEKLSECGVNVSFSPVRLVDELGIVAGLERLSAEFKARPPVILPFDDNDLELLKKGIEIDVVNRFPGAVEEKRN
jgi:hypothetical protein